MNPKDTAISKARALRRLRDVGLDRSMTGYYYIAHYPPLRAMRSLSPGERESMFQDVEGRDFEVYFHIPFCEVSCSFCHFYKEFNATEESVWDLLKLELAELERTRLLLGPIRARSLYVGGGTPSVLSAKQIGYLLEEVFRTVAISDHAEVKFELYPRSYSKPELADRLTVLREFGVTDVVIDLESGDRGALAQVGRRNSSLEEYLTLLDRCEDHGFDSVVTALVLGLPGETFESLQSTLEALTARECVQVINTFPLIVRPPDAIYRRYQRIPRDFPTSEERDALWIFARDFLRSRGFAEGPISYLSRPGKRPEQQSEKFECVNLVGFGPAAFGYLNFADGAAQYFNACDVRDYFERLRGEELPTWRAGRLDQADRARRRLIFALANCRRVSLQSIEREYGISMDALVGRELCSLIDLGLIAGVPGTDLVEYTEEGLCRLEEISYFLSSTRIRDLCEGPHPTDREQLALRRHHYYIQMDPQQRQLFEMLVSSYSGETIECLGAAPGQRGHR